MNIINRTFLTAMVFSLSIGSSSNLQASGNTDIEPKAIANQEVISFTELLGYLPDAPQGWTADEPKGETNSLGDYHVSQVAQTYSNGDKKIKISIFNSTFNSALQLPLALASMFGRESTEGYNKGIEIDGIPGREEYAYDSKQGSLNLLVDNGLLVQIDGRNIEDVELREWWQLIDLQSLNETAEEQVL